MVKVRKDLTGGYKQPSYLRQSWWVIKFAVKLWIEKHNKKKKG